MLTIHYLDLNDLCNILHFCLFIHLFNFAIVGIKPSPLQMQVISDFRASNKYFLYTYVAYLLGYCSFYLLEHLNLCILEVYWLVNYTIFTMTVSELRLPCLFFFNWNLTSISQQLCALGEFLLPSFYRTASVLTFNSLLHLWMVYFVWNLHFL